MSSSSSSGVDQMNLAAATATLILTFGSFIPGSIGHILNVIVFTRPSLRCHSCTNYFLASTIANLFVMFVVLPVRIASNSFNQSLSEGNQILCKLEYYLFYCARSLSCWFIVLVCIDRCIHASGNVQWRRRLNSPRIYLSAIVMTTLFIIIGYIHMPIFYNLVITVNANGRVTSFCASQRGIYRTFITFWHITIYALSPSTLMLFLGLMTIYNIHQRRMRIAPTNINNQISTRRTESQLLRMLTVQVLMITLTTIPGQIVLIYQTLTSFQTKSLYVQAQERFALQLLGGLGYLSHASGFYLYTLTGSLFRKELIKILRKIFYLFLNEQNQTNTRTTPNITVKSQNQKRFVNDNNDQQQIEFK